MSLQTKKAKEEVLKWCQDVTKGYQNVNITDFTTSFADGYAFCALMHKFKPEAIDLNSLNPSTPEDNLDYALDTAVEKFEVPTDLTAKDFIVDDTSKMKEVYKIICAFFKKYNKDSNLINARNSTTFGLKLRNEKNKQEVQETKPDTNEETKVEETKVEEKEPETKEPETKEPETKEEEFNCEECDEQTATKYCKDCATKQCEDCAKSLHKVKKRKDHVLVSVKEFLSSLPKKEEKEVKQQPKVEEKDDGPVGKCLLHPEIKIAAYCRTCDEPICTTCLLSNHDGHKKMNLEEAKPISTEEYLNILDDIKDTHNLLTRFKNNLNDNMNITLKTVKDYFENIRKTLNEKETKLLDVLKKFSDENNTKLDGELKTHSDMIKRMEDEKVFVEQLKIKIDAKNVVKKMNENKEHLVPITYAFFKNDKIVDFIEVDLDVQEGKQKVLFTNIKKGDLPSSNIQVFDANLKNTETKTEEKKPDETKTEETNEKKPFSDEDN